MLNFNSHIKGWVVYGIGYFDHSFPPQLESLTA